MEMLVPLVVGSSIAAGALVIYPATMYALDMSPYIYANTRCSARSGLILNKQQYDSLIAASSQKEFLAQLEDTYYCYIIEHATSFSNFSQMLDKDLFNTYQWLFKVVPDKIKPILKSMKLKFEINELKKALNRVMDNQEPGELAFIEDEMIKLKLEGIKDFPSFLAIMENSGYAHIFTNASPENITKINNSLDSYYFDTVSKEINKCNDEKAAMPFKEYWATYIDLINLRLVLRKIVNQEEEATLLEGGLLNKNELLGVSDMAQLESLLSSSVYSDFIDSTDPFGVETSIYKYLKKVAFEVSAKHTLKAGSIVKFILLKELETRNLNIINKLKLENYPAEEIEKLIVA